MSSYEKNNDSEDELTKFHNCRINSCSRLYDGKLFRCLYLYTGYVSGKLPLDDTIVNINQGSGKGLSKEFR